MSEVFNGSGCGFMVAKEPLKDIPKDLFIPPDALELWLESFSGPLDLLLYLIRRQNLDIMDIPIVMVTKQYLDYIAMMDEHRLELAADYLVMAAVLAEIKSRLLLPISQEASDEEEDPRMVLVKRLQTYEQFKLAAQEMDKLTRLDRDVFSVELSMDMILPKQFPPVLLSDLFNALSNLHQKQSHHASHQITLEAETLSVRERMVYVLESLQQHTRIEFSHLYRKEEGRLGVVVSFLAILELAKQSLLVVTQVKPYATIHLQRPENE